MRGRLFAGAGALAVALCATAGTAHAAPPAGVNPKVVELEIVDCGEFTGSVTVVTTGTGQGGGSIVGFAGGQVGIVIGFTPAAERFPGELLDCTLEVEGTEVTFPIFVPQP
jgi:hypothetical protein